MRNMFSAGELAKYQNISKQTLLFYDKIGLFKPAFTDPDNGYRYYSADQLDHLDTILIMKKIGFSLQEIRAHMAAFTTENSLVFLRQQLTVIDQKLKELSLIKNRLEHRCAEVEHAAFCTDTTPLLSVMGPVHILYHTIEKPYSTTEVSLATKQCYSQALRDDLPIFFQCGVSIPLDHIRSGHFLEATTAFVTTDFVPSVENIKQLPRGLTASTFHIGRYSDIGQAYRRLLAFCEHNHLTILSDSYEFCINDYITSRNENEFVTQILFYVETDEARGLQD